MDTIFHEKQEGGLCAQHCLNSLLQGPYYTAFDLAEFARQLDDEEREHMKEGDVNSAEFLKFMEFADLRSTNKELLELDLEQPSSNMDDSGFFSIQVLCKALQVWELELVPFRSPDAAFARQQPVMQNAFICNLQQHWFTIRKLGQQWFNLNSTQSGPVLITETYLSLFLAQLEQEGYSIFIVNGSLPTCEADRILTNHPVSQKSTRTGKSGLTEPNQSHSQSAEPAKTADPDEVREKRLQYFERMKISEKSNTSQIADSVESSNTSDSSHQDKGTKEESSKGSDRSNERMVNMESDRASLMTNIEETEEELLKAAIELSKVRQ